MRSRSIRAQAAQPDSTLRRTSARRRRERGGKRLIARASAANAPGQRTKNRSSSVRRVGRRASEPMEVRTTSTFSCDIAHRVSRGGVPPVDALNAIRNDGSAVLQNLEGFDPPLVHRDVDAKL